MVAFDSGTMPLRRKRCKAGPIEGLISGDARLNSWLFSCVDCRFQVRLFRARRYLGCPELVLLSVVVDRSAAQQRWVPRDRVE